MNTASSSESGSYSTNHTRPFFYAQPTAQQPFPNPWYLSHAYSPYCVPAPGYRSGNPYFPFYSVALHEYPGYFVPQHPVHARVNRRPYFNGPPPSPVFYHATRFRHYSTSGKKMETKETQTDPRQPESKPKRHQDVLGTETKGCDAGNMACASSGIGTETESASTNQDSSGSSIVVDRELHNKSLSRSTQYRNLPTGSYAFEKEEVRIEYGNGSPAIQLWKSFKETIPLYDVASGKPVPENIVQRDLFSVSSCEGMLYGPHEGEKMVPGASLDERKTALPSKQAVEATQGSEVQTHGVKLDAEKQMITSQQAKTLSDDTMAVQVTELVRSASTEQPVVRQDVVAAKKPSSKKSTASKTPQDEPSLVQPAGLLPPSMEVMDDLSCQQKKLNLSHGAANDSPRDGSVWCDESMRYVPSDSWLACLDSMDTNYDYGLCLPQRKPPSVLSLSSDDMSSREESSSIDNAPVSYFAPDYVLQKSMYTFQKGTEGLKREKITSGGSLNEDEVVGKEQMNSLNDKDSKNSSTVKTKEASSKGRKLGDLPRSSSQKKTHSLKNKAPKSLPEVEDSEEYSVREEEEEQDEEEEEEDDDDMDEIEYFFQEATPYGILTPSKGSFYPVGQRVLWKPPKNAIPAQFIGWPVQEKINRIGLGENIGVLYKPKEKVQDEVAYSDYGCYGRKRPTARREGPEHQRALWKLLGGCPPLVKLKKKRIGKPLSKCRDTRHEVEEEVWEMPRSVHKVQASRKLA
ncbi:uncharacterized protein LOC128970093 [Indicator indicator]|uniref:uncharacterized protein LOC128970093 n=1 Tax=Indicator indicator TaxID=1002788 RepID=UPI0023DFE05F|nr:uncharacterized protein LOC128970093 [Indicator indicator]